MKHKNLHIESLKKRTSFFHANRFLFNALYKGEKFRCNVCGTNLKRMLPIRQNKRHISMCPVCSSIESTRVLWFFLKDEILGKKSRKRILYFVPEKSILENLKHQNIELQTAKISYFNEKYHRRYEGSRFDIIILSHVLEYVEDEEQVFPEILRLLRPGGQAIIQTVIHPEMDRTYDNINTEEDKDRLKNYALLGMRRVYGLNFIKSLQKAGFQATKLDYADKLGPRAKKYYKLGNRHFELIFYCKK